MHTLKHQNPLVVGVLALIVGLGIGYFGAGAFAKAPARTGTFARGGAGTTFARGGGAGLLTGTVAKEDSGSLTLNTRDGSSHVVLFTPDTAVSKSVAGSMSDVTVGSTVIVSGSANSDGSLSAAVIQLRPAGDPSAPGTNAPMIPAPQPN